MTALPPWRPLLRGAREREGRSPAGRWLQLATVASEGIPRVHTLEFRSWADGAALDLLTDGRSVKPAELRQQPAVELCWLLPKARCPFRLRGEVLILPADVELDERQRHLGRLTPGGRALWVWPKPCAPLDSAAAFPAELADDTPPPEHFKLDAHLSRAGGVAGAEGSSASAPPLGPRWRLERGAPESLSGRLSRCAQCARPRRFRAHQISRLQRHAENLIQDRVSRVKPLGRLASIKLAGEAP